MDRKTAWFLTLRPKTLPLALSYILIGNMLGFYTTHQFNIAIFLLSLVTAALLQILSNIANDYGDFQKQTDTKERIGPLRGIQHSVLTSKDLKKAIIFVILAILICGGALLVVSDVTFKAYLIMAGIGCLAIIAAITYTVGKKPYGYMGLGDVFVFIFFGGVAVLGSAYLQSKTFNYQDIYISVACGFLAMAVLNINNLRDVQQDKKNKKNTIVVYFGVHFAKVYYTTLLALAFILYLAFSWQFVPIGLARFIYLLTIPEAYKLIKIVWTYQEPRELNQVLGKTALLSLGINILFSITLIIAQ